MAKLPSALVSLVHHIELSKAGWWDLTVEKLIQTALWPENKPLTTQQIVSYIMRTTNVRLPSEQLHPIISRLVESGTLIKYTDETYKLTQDHLI